MRSLAPVPDTITDVHGRPRFGSYRGNLPRIDIGALSPGRLFRLAHHKRWMYACIASDEALIALAIVDIGYASNAFIYALDARDLRMLSVASVVGPPFAASVGDGAGGGGGATFRFGSTHLRIDQPAGGTALWIDASAKDIEVRARLETQKAPPAIAAIAHIPDSSPGLLDMTEKRALLDVSGEAVIAGRRVSLDGALGGYDYTNGLLARRTTWRWAFALGRARTGERVGLNLVQGFVGDAECAAWVDGDLYPLAEGQFEFDIGRPLSEWRVRTADGGVDLLFQPGGMHAEHRDYGLLASHFIQPAGVFSGRLSLEGRGELELERVLGVTEDQDMLW
jgi:hypothetical protein